MKDPYKKLAMKAKLISTNENTKMNAASVHDAYVSVQNGKVST